MVTGHDIDFIDRTPETLPTRPVFRSTIIKTKQLVEHNSIVPRKSQRFRNIPTALNDIHFLCDVKFWHSWQYTVISNSDFVKRADIQKQIKRFMRKNNVSIECQLNALKEELQVKCNLLCFLFVFVVFLFVFL